MLLTIFHLYLRRDYQKKNGEYPIYLRITHNRKHRYISTGVSVLVQNWNPEKEVIRKNHRNASVLNETLRNKIKEAQKVQSDLSKNGQESAKTIRERLRSTQKADFFELADIILDELKSAGNLYTYKNTRVAFGKLEKFEGGRVLPLKNIDTGYLEKFEKYLKTEYNNSPNTINKNFEGIRKVIRMALQSYLINKDPFIYFEGAKRKKSNGKTKLDKITFLEKMTDNYHPEKLQLLQEDLRAFIKSTGRQAGMEVEIVFIECLYDAFQRTYHDHETLNSVSKDQFYRFLSNHGNILDSNKDLLKLAIEIGVDKYGESYGHDLAEFIELKGFEKLVNDKVNEIGTGQTKPVNSSIKALKGGRKPTYEIEDIREWFNELSREPDHPL